MFVKYINISNVYLVHDITIRVLATFNLIIINSSLTVDLGPSVGLITWYCKTYRNSHYKDKTISWWCHLLIGSHQHRNPIKWWCHRENMLCIDTCIIVIAIFYIGVLVNGIHYLEPQNNCPLHHHKGMCNFAPLPYLDEEGGTTATRWLSQCFYVKICFLLMNETKNPQQLHCGRSIPATNKG